MTKAAELAKMGEVLTNSQIGGRRNIIINGAMQVAQRGTSSTSTGRQTLDRFEAIASSFGEATVTQSQDSTSPDEFGKSYKVAIGSTAETVGASEQQYIRYKVEAQDLQQLKYGTSDAESMTLSFYVRSSVTGTFPISFYLNDSDKNHVKTYTINSADTWERKTITVTGNTSDAINNDTGIGLSIHWFLTLGSSYLGNTSSLNSWVTYGNSNFAANVNPNFGANSNATFFLTGVQLEVGSVATPFEHRSFGEEIALCQRYYTVIADGSYASGQGAFGVGAMYGTTVAYGAVDLPTEMRSNPSVESTDASNYMVFYRAGAGDLIDEVAFSISHPNRVEFFNQTDISGTSGHAGFFRLNSTSARLAAKAEL